VRDCWRRLRRAQVTVERHASRDRCHARRRRRVAPATAQRCAGQTQNSTHSNAANASAREPKQVVLNRALIHKNQRAMRTQRTEWSSSEAVIRTSEPTAQAQQVRGKRCGSGSVVRRNGYRWQCGMACGAWRIQRKKRRTMVEPIRSGYRELQAQNLPM